MKLPHAQIECDYTGGRITWKKKREPIIDESDDPLSKIVSAASSAFAALVEKASKIETERVHWLGDFSPQSFEYKFSL